MMGPPFRLVLLAGVLAVGACATRSPVGSYVAPLAATDTAPIVQTITGFVADHLPPGQSTVWLDPPPADQKANALTPAVADALRQRGYALAAVATANSPAHHVRYRITPLDNGLLLRVDVDQTEGSCLLRHDKGGALIPSAPLAVRSNT